MKLAEIKITMIMENDFTERELDDMCEELEDFQYKLKVLTSEFEKSNPIVKVKITD